MNFFLDKDADKTEEFNLDDDTEVIVEDNGSGEKGGSTVEIISTARPDISAARLEVSTAEPKTPPAITTLFDDKDITIADTKRDQDQIKRDAEVTLKIQADLDEEVRTERERQEEASKASLTELYDEVQEQIEVDHELASRLTHEEKEKYTIKESSSSQQKSPKKQKVNDQESVDSDKKTQEMFKEKTEGNAKFHQIVDLLTSSSIHHALIVSPTIYASNIEQFCNIANSQTINDGKQIYATIRPEGAPIQSSNPPLSTSNTVRIGEDMMEHKIELTDPVPQTPHDSPLSGGHTSGSDEGSMTQKELTDICTTLSQKVLDLEKVKTAQANEIASLKKRVTKLEQRQISRISSLHPFGADEEVIVEEKGSGEKGGSTAETVSTARPDISVARPEVSTAAPKTPSKTTTLFDDEDVTIVDTLTKKRDQDQIKRDDKVALKIQADLDAEVKTEKERQEEASKAALAKLFDEVQAQIDDDHEMAVRLTHKEQEKYIVKERSKLLAEFFKRRKKQLAKERAEAIKSNPPTKTQLRNLMMTYLKHTEKRYPLAKEILEEMLSWRLEAKTKSTLALHLIKFIKLQIEEK
nr:hypothetical protein [Tanacetum cinerariifolium]